jgi:hypothetical protein
MAATQSIRLGPAEHFPALHLLYGVIEALHRVID